MKLYRIEPRIHTLQGLSEWCDGVQGEAKYLAALDESMAIEMVECSLAEDDGTIIDQESGYCNNNYCIVDYEVVYVKDLQNQPDLCK